MTTAYQMEWVAEGTGRWAAEKRDWWLVWLVAFELTLGGGCSILFLWRFA